MSWQNCVLTSNQERILSLNSQSHWSHSDRDVMSFHKTTLSQSNKEAHQLSENKTQAESRRRRRLLTQDVQPSQEEGTETEQHGTRNGVWKRCMSQHCLLVVLLWPLIGLQNHLHSILTQSLRTAFLRFPARCRLGLCCSSLWPIYSSHEKFWPRSENCLCS